MKIKIATYSNPETSIISKSKKILTDFLFDFDFTFTDNDADVIFFASGGSEQDALDSFSRTTGTIILLANSRGNSYAAATEALSYLIDNGIKAHLINIEEEKAKEDFQIAFKEKTTGKLKGKKVALIGEVSDWLINSKVEEKSIQKIFGIDLIHLPWNKLPDYRTLDIDETFINNFDNINRNDLLETSKVYRLLKNIIYEYRLSGFSIECFPMAKSHKTTACLPLALINAEGITASCEGDLTSLIGMMYIKELTGKIPWQANLAGINGNKVLWAHCTAPLNMLNEINITTHYETNSGTAIQGKIKGEECNIFRFNKTLTKQFYCKGKIIATPKHNFACRTQIETILPNECINLLRNNPLGNHHLIWI
ncbi:MAG: hypothetical protein LBP67_03400 [Bacteroidales bacterium]|jgi:L-fucose isomerase-like protein|nr:hypothetical protein [Bacteroidales bacterium]